MPRLEDDQVLALLLRVLSRWRSQGDVNIRQRVQADIAALWPQRSKEHWRWVFHLLYNHVRDGKKVSRVLETREGLDAGYRFEIVMDVDERTDMYFELVMDERDQDDPRIYLVSVHKSSRG